jgi:hypothetical protein
MPNLDRFSQPMPWEGKAPAETDEPILCDHCGEAIASGEYYAITYNSHGDRYKLHKECLAEFFEGDLRTMKAS